MIYLDPNTEYTIEDDIVKLHFEEDKIRVRELVIRGISIDLTGVRTAHVDIFQIPTPNKVFTYINIHYLIMVNTQQDDIRYVKSYQTISVKDIDDIKINIQDTDGGYTIRIDEKEEY